ncbi:mCG12883 [Mus musculus]|nr:mCG12883 [Mus musculus]
MALHLRTPWRWFTVGSEQPLTGQHLSCCIHRAEGGCGHPAQRSRMSRIVPTFN